MGEFKRKGLGFGDVKPPRSNTKTPRPGEVVGMLEWPKKPKYVEMRLFSPANTDLPGMVSEGGHWLKIEVADREKKGKTRVIDIYKQCLAYDPGSQERDSTVNCPYCKIGKFGKDGNNRFSNGFYALAIIRGEQESAPKKNKISKAEVKSGVITLDSDAWTPVRVVKIPSSVANKLQELSERNFVKKGSDKKAFPITHAKYGIDIAIKYDPNGAGTDKYTVEKGERTPLTEEELGYLVWDLNSLPPPDDLKTAKAEADNLKNKLVGGGDEESEYEDDEDEDEDEKPKKKGKSAPAKKGKKKSDEDDEDDDDEDDDEDDEEDEEDDEDEDEKPKKSKKKPAKSKKKSDDEDEEDEDEDEEDEDEDEEDEDEEDEDEEEEDDEDDEDEKPKSKKKPAAKSKSKKSKDDEDEDDEDEDDEDEEDEDEDDEEDEKPKSKKKPAAKSKPKAKSKKSEDDDEDDDLDLDEDEDEDEKPKKKKKK